MGTNSEINNLIFYDGECQFCNNAVNFIFRTEVRLESGRRLYFCTLQSPFSQQMLKKYGVPSGYTDSLLFFQDGKLFDRSVAVFRIASFLKYPWRMVRVFRTIPPALANVFYNLIAQHRFRLMGKKDYCIVPNASLRKRFLE